MNKIALWENIRADDWIAELLIIASNDEHTTLSNFVNQVKSHCSKRHI